MLFGVSKIEVHIFDRTILSGFTRRGFTTKEDTGTSSTQKHRYVYLT